MINKIFDEAALRKNAQDAVKAVEDFDKHLEKLRGNLSKLSIKIEIGSTADIVKSLNTLNEEINSAKKNIESLRSAQVSAAKAATEAAKAAKLLAQEQEILNRAKRAGKKITVSLDEALNKEATTMAEAAAQNTVLRKAAKELDLTHEENKDTLEEYNAKINKNTEFIRENSDAATRQKMNIGNYKSVLSGLNVSVSQIIREAPAAKYGLDVFFLAISNNIPMLYDSIKALQEHNKAMRAAGKANETQSVFKAFMSSLFSFNTLIMAGVTILTLYGKEIIEWVKNLFNGKDAVDRLKYSQESLNKAWVKGRMDAQEEIVKLNLLYQAATNSSTGIDSIRQAQTKLKELYPEIFSNYSNEEFLLGKAKGAYESLTQAIIKTAIAKARINEITRLSEEQIKLFPNVDIYNLDDANKKLEELGKKSNNVYQEILSIKEKAIGNFNPVGASTFAPTNINLFGIPEYDLLKDEYDKYQRQISALTTVRDKYLKPIDSQILKIKEDTESFLKSFGTTGKGGKEGGKEAEKYADGTIGWYEALISELEKRAKDVKDSGTWKGIQQLIQEAKDNISRIKGEKTDYEKILYEIIEENTVLSITKEKERNIAAINKWYEEQVSQIKDISGGLEKAESESRRLLSESRDRKIEDEEMKAEEKISKEAQKWSRAAKRIIKEAIEKIKTEGNTEEEKIEIGIIVAETELTEMYNKGKISEGKYQDSLLRIQQEGQRKRLKSQADALQEQLEYMQKERGKYLKRLEELEKNTEKSEADLIEIGKIKGTENEDGEFVGGILESLSQEKIENISSSIKRLIAELGLLDEQIKKSENDKPPIDPEKLEMSNKILQSTSQLIDEIGSMFDAMYEARIQKIEEEAEAVEDANSRELESLEKMYEQGAISQEEYESRKRLQEELTAAKHEELEKKKAELQLKQAKLQKGISITQAVINTALSVTNALNTPPFPLGLALAAIAAAMGAVQIATIIAEPLPTYAKGTAYHKGGLAVVGDGGNKELIMTGDSAYVTPDTPTIMNIPKGAKVFPDVSLLRADDLEWTKQPRSIGIERMMIDEETGEPIIINDYGNIEEELIKARKAIERQNKEIRRAERDRKFNEYKNRAL